MRGFFLEKKMDEMLDPVDIANVKIDLEHIGEGSNEDKIVTPRYGSPFKSLPMVSREAENRGGYISAPTLTALQAIMPTYNWQLARDDSTGNDYRWNPAATPTPQWEPTGRNFIQDSINYTNTSLPITTNNLYVSANIKTGLYVQPSTGNLLTEPANAIAYFPVRAGKTYAIKASDVRTAYLVVSLSSNNTMTSGKQQTLVALNTTSDPNILTFTVPANSDFKYAFTNVLWPNFTFDIRSSLIVQERTTIKSSVSSIRGVEIEDSYIRSIVRGLEDKNFVSASDVIKVVNFYSSSNDTANLYLASDTALMSPLDGTALGRWAVEAGKTYTVKSSKFLATAIVGLSADSTTAPAKATTKVTLTNTADPLVKTFTVPSGSTAKFAFFTVLLPSQLYDVRGALVVNEGIDKIVTEVQGAKITDESAQLKLKQLAIDMENIRRGDSILKGKKWVAVGDSQTQPNSWAALKYPDFIANIVGGMQIENLGISGSGFGDRTTVADYVATVNPDYITFFLGTNDFGVINDERVGRDPPLYYPMGDFLTLTNSTVAGAINLTLKNMMDRFPTAKIILFTPLPRGSRSDKPNWGENPPKNSSGVSLEDISNMIIRYARHYGFPVLDLYRLSTIQVWNDAAQAKYMNLTDGVHINDAGHALIGHIALKFMEAC